MISNPAPGFCDDDRVNELVCGKQSEYAHLTLGTISQLLLTGTSQVISWWTNNYTNGRSSGWLLDAKIQTKTFVWTDACLAMDW